jgi:flagellar P-ring protein precursor FlgI
MNVYAIILFVLLSFVQNAYSLNRIKDIATAQGFRDNLLVGYGIVVGLNGTGDNLKNIVFAQKGLTDFLERLGVNVQGADLKTKNIAAVTITANLPPFSKQGSKIDVRVSALGDSKSLKGGILLATPLLGADGNVYAVAQGPLSISSFLPSNDKVKTRGSAIETTGYIQNGAIVELEINFKFDELNDMKFILKNPDFSTAISVADTINENIAGNLAKAIDPSTISVKIPNRRKKDLVEFVAEIEQMYVKIDSKAKIIIDEATGTIVLGGDVRMSKVAIAQGNLIITVGKAPNDEQRGSKIVELEEANLSDLVSGLNKLGIWPRDMINILQNIKAAGALQAEIELR